MKALILALALLTPLASRAATNLTCASEGTGGPLTITITARNGIDRVGSRLHIHAKGILTTDFDALVDKVDACDADRLVVDVTTLAAGGVINADSGQATITIQRAGDEAPRTGSIVLTKLPKVRPPLRLATRYELSACQGEL